MLLTFRQLSGRGHDIRNRRYGWVTLMAVLRRTGAAPILIKWVRAGLPYIGASAGAVIMGTSIGACDCTRWPP